MSYLEYSETFVWCILLDLASVTIIISGIGTESLTNCCSSYNLLCRLSALV